LALNKVNVLASFSNATGTLPQFPLTLAGGTLYGTTYSGGGQGMGTVFSVPVAGGAPTVLASSFSATLTSGLIVSGNTLFGETGSYYVGNDSSVVGEVFSLPITGGTPTVLASFNFSGPYGNDPFGGLALSGTTLYGVTSNGGVNGDGIIFSLPVSGGTPTILTSFSSTDPVPRFGLTLSGSTLYGETGGGGANGMGGVFSMPITGGTPTLLGSFDSADGSDPYGGLTVSGNTLYGTTAADGQYGNTTGEVFSLPLTGGTPTVLGSPFLSNPHGVVISGDTLYGAGTANQIEPFDGVYSMPITGGASTVLAHFNNQSVDGGFPWGGVTISGNAIYGTTSEGGANGDGTVFEISTIVPEPASVSALAVGVLCLLVRRSRSVAKY
jgi:uncharacterized repeat protein (TIGR03803 family)